MDAQDIIKDLLQTMTQSEVAKRVGCTQSAVSKWLSGSEPLYSLGKRLELLHRETLASRGE